MKNRIPESAILKSILDYLRMRGYVCKRNNAGKMFGENHGKRWMVNVGEPGWPDIIGMLKDGRFFGIEVKASGGLVSDIQKRVLERMKASNAVAFVAYDLNDVIEKGF